MKKTEKEKKWTTRCQILKGVCLFYVLKVYGCFFCFPTSLLRTRGDLFSICPGSRLLDGSVIDATEATALTFNVHLIDIYVCSQGPRDDSGGGGFGEGGWAEQPDRAGPTTTNSRGTPFIFLFKPLTVRWRTDIGAVRGAETGRTKSRVLGFHTFLL